MFARLLFESFRRRLRPKAFVLLVLVLAMSICTAMLSVATDLGDRMSQELRKASGANLVITPIEETLDVTIGGVSLRPANDGGFIHESDLPAIKGVFWGHNILGYAPFLSDRQTVVTRGRTLQITLTGTYFSRTMKYGQEEFQTGVRHLNGFWKITGEWPSDVGAGVLVGSDLASRTGLRIGDVLATRTQELRVTGILDSGGAEDHAIIAPLHLVQQILQKPDAVQKVLVSALTKPEDAFARQDPATLSGAALEKWSCSPYANSIAYQIQETLPGSYVEQIRQVEQTQGKVLSRISLLMLLLTLVTLTASALAIFAILASTLLRQRHTIGLLKCLGAGNGILVALFLIEAALLGITGGTMGFGLGSFLARHMGQTVFGSSIVVHPVVFIVVLMIALAVAFSGSLGAIFKAIRLDPAIVLRGSH
jgi:putative ABC transport system permease protein